MIVADEEEVGIPVPKVYGWKVRLSEYGRRGVYHHKEAGGALLSTMWPD